MPFPRAVLAGMLLAVVAVACGDDAPSEPDMLLDLPDAVPGDIVGLSANDGSRTVEWIDRLDGTIHAFPVDGNGDDAVETLATIEVATEGEQRGLLGQVVIDGRRFAAWTEPATLDLLVGEVDVDGGTRIVWNAGPSGSGAIGGVMGELDGRILVGVGRNTGFDAESGVGGAMLTLDPDGDPDQEPDVISVGYTNPWAFAVVDGSEVWVADNAAGPDPDDESVDDIERIGRAEQQPDRSTMTRIAEPGRAPSAMIPLTDGRLGICGFLDAELRAYEIIDGSELDPPNPATVDLERSDVVRAGTIMPCLTGAAIFDDGTIVTAALGDPGLSLQILRP